MDTTKQIVSERKGTVPGQVDPISNLKSVKKLYP